MQKFFDIATIELINVSGRFLFDTNIWLYLNGPYSGPAKYETRLYSKLYSSILKAGGEVYLEPVILSEYFNRYIKIIYEEELQNGASSLPFKQFRLTDAYKAACQEINQHIESMMNHLTVAQAQLDSECLKRICTRLAKGDIDFNDAVIVRICHEHSLTLVTHDRDFSGASIRILSGNAHYKK